MNDTSLSLDEIGLEMGTDKSSGGHNYLVFYERFFERIRDKTLKILEIGVLEGASIKTWEEYFPNANIIGADINPGAVKFAKKRIAIEIIDQSNIQNLVDLGVKHGPFDIIIEDGSHLWEHQITSLRILFPFLKEGGFYIVEDLQTNFGELANSYRGISSISCIEYLKKLVDLRVATNMIDISQEEDSFLRTYGRAIEFLSFYKHACLIEKGLEQAKKFTYQLNHESLIPVYQDKPPPYRIFAHVGLVGDVEDNGFGSLSAKLIRGCYIEGFGLQCLPEFEAEIKYRGRLQDGTWTDWVFGNEFVGSRGRGIALTGYSIELSQKLEESHSVLLIGAFTNKESLVSVQNGQDCISSMSGEYLRGMQIMLRPR